MPTWRRVLGSAFLLICGTPLAAQDGPASEREMRPLGAWHRVDVYGPDLGRRGVRERVSPDGVLRGQFNGMRQEVLRLEASGFSFRLTRDDFDSATVHLIRPAIVAGATSVMIASGGWGLATYRQDNILPLAPLALAAGTLWLAPRLRALHRDTVLMGRRAERPRVAWLQGAAGAATMSVGDTVLLDRIAPCADEAPVPRALISAVTDSGVLVNDAHGRVGFLRASEGVGLLLPTRYGIGDAVMDLAGGAFFGATAMLVSVPLSLAFFTDPRWIAPNFWPVTAVSAGVGFALGATTAERARVLYGTLVTSRSGPPTPTACRVSWQPLAPRGG